LDISRWYYDETSEWTLDYPPLFAYMEFVLGKIAKFVDPKITDITNLNYKATECIVFQRLTVVLLGDIVLFFALRR
jgi:alpha-1,3-glucosyltransferase